MSAIRMDNVPASLLPLLGPTAWRSVLAEYVRDPSSILLVATEDDRVQGYALATARSVVVQRRALARSPTLWVSVLRSALTHPRAILPIVRRAARLIRPARHSALSTEPVFHLLDIVVASDARRSGLGRALVQSILEVAADRGHTEIGLTVLADNAAAIRLYERAGFLSSGHTTGDGRSFLRMRRAMG